VCDACVKRSVGLLSSVSCVYACVHAHVAQNSKKAALGGSTGVGSSSSSAAVGTKAVLSRNTSQSTVGRGAGNAMLVVESTLAVNVRAHAGTRSAAADAALGDLDSFLDGDDDVDKQPVKKAPTRSAPVRATPASPTRAISPPPGACAERLERD
jgi:hypothetical protein